MLLVSLFDVLAEDFSAPVMVKNENVARRMFWNTIEKMGVKSNEYQLYQVGEFNVSTGEITGQTSLLPISDSSDDPNE